METLNEIAMNLLIASDRMIIFTTLILQIYVLILYHTVLPKAFIILKNFHCAREMA